MERDWSAYAGQYHIAICPKGLGCTSLWDRRASPSPVSSKATEAWISSVVHDVSSGEIRTGSAITTTP